MSPTRPFGQVAIVNAREQPVYVCYVKPTEFVTDYRTRYSGVRPFHMKHALPFDQVQREVCAAHHAALPPASPTTALPLFALRRAPPLLDWHQAHSSP